LITAAERLFAQQGFDSVTMKQITTEAGQRNASALHYHFGSKWALVGAIIARRMPGINVRRHALLDDVEKADQANDPRVVVDALVRPVAELLDEGNEGRYWMSFLLQVWNTPGSRLAELVPAEFNTGIVRGASFLAVSMAHLPERIVQQRLSLLPGLVLQAVGDYRGFGAGERRPGPGLGPVFYEGLLDMLTAALVAPVYAPTKEALSDRTAGD
jgi:AcrR family transcriptional regulator